MRRSRVRAATSGSTWFPSGASSMCSGMPSWTRPRAAPESELDPAHFMRLSLAIFLAALALLVAFQMLTGAINLRGLLTDKVSGGFSPGRLQLLAATAMGAGWYLMQAL